MIDRLIAMLQQDGLLLSDQEIDALSEAQSVLHDEDIADALWLASKIGGAYEVEHSDRPEVSDEAEAESSIQIIDDNSPPDAPPSFVSAYMPQATKPEPSSVETPEQGLPIQVQAAPALPNPRDISRSLRPLMRKVPSLTRSELDEIATVNRIAERDIWVPILRPSPERWFDLELVIEANPFSFIWQDTLDEFQQLLECQGAFRNVRTWYVRQGATGQPELVAKKQQWADTKQSQPLRSHKELVDASGRRLVLLISDCRSELWRQGKIHDWLALWGQHGPAAIAQLLPERLWDESELDVGFAAQVSALIPGAPNPKLQVRELPVRTAIAPADALTVPIITLTVGALKQWALVVAAAGRQRSPARLFDRSWVKDPERDRTRGVFRPQSAQERVELFKATASPPAQRLASMMAAVPVEMAVVHLIQQELLTEIQPVHIAEVYSSGLLEAIKPDPAKPDAPVRYDFVKDVRGLLNAATPLDQTLDVLEALSQRIAKTLGFEIKSFTALLSPKSAWSKEAKDAILPFAQIATEVLHRLGGDYAELAQLVEQDASGRPDWIQPIDRDPIEHLQTLEFDTARFIDAEPEPGEDFPPIQTESFTITAISIDEAPALALEIFEFVVPSIAPKARGLFQLTPQMEITRRRAQNQRFIEPLSEAIVLEMVAIPGGEFEMGSPADEPGRSNSEGLRHRVTVPAFFMGRYPVTQAQWRAVAGLPQIEHTLDPDPSHFTGDSRPVENVSWYDAVEFCARLSAHSQRAYRLPSEAEWEYACRAGTTTPFYFGSMITPELANYDGNSTYNNGPKGENRQETTPVDHFEYANGWGLCDMHGNVWEWCADHWYSNYDGAPTDGSAWINAKADKNARRVKRGGSWSYISWYCRSATRDDDYPRSTVRNLGFRVVCSAL